MTHEEIRVALLRIVQTSSDPFRINLALQTLRTIIAADRAACPQAIDWEGIIEAYRLKETKPD
jgi:hypothetical protein